MSTDCRALTIVTVFLGIVMLGFWIGSACAIYRGDRPVSDLQYRVAALQVQIESLRT